MVIRKCKLRSTREAAKVLGIHHITLQRYVMTKKVSAPSVQKVGGVRVRLWRKEDIENVRKFAEDSERRSIGKKRAKTKATSKKK